MVATNLSYANMPYWGCLPIMHTNFGGDTQICTIEPYSAYNVGYSLNPVAQQTWGPMGGSIFNCYAASPYGGGGGCSTPGMQDAIIRGAQQLLAPALNNLTSMNLNRCLGNISQMKTRLEAGLQDPNVSDDDKEKINAKLDEIAAKENELQEIAKSTDLDPQTAYQKVAGLEKDVRGIMTSTAKLLNEIAQASTTTSTEESTSTEEASSTEETTSTDETTSTSAYESTSTDETSQGKVDEFGADVIAAVDQFHSATYRWGTDNDKMKEVLDLVTKDNVMELMLAWNKFHSAEKGESLMEAFMWDASSGDKEKYGKAIASALRQKADELGIYDECREDFAAIDKEMGSWFYISNDISKNYDNIIKKIAEKMGSKYGSPVSTQKSEE